MVVAALTVFTPVGGSGGRPWLLSSVQLASLWRGECWPGAVMCGLLDLR